MKYALVIMLLASSFFAGAQSLKEALYGGKLKNDAGTVIRKTDDLSTKIDTTRKATPDSLKAKAPAVAPATTAPIGAAAPKKTAEAIDSAVQAQVVTPGTTGNVTIPVAEPEVAAVTPAEKPKDNNALWKDYMNSMQPVLQAEVLPSKKVKKGSYSVMVSYSIDTDGQTHITDVFVAPENDYIRDQVKNRLTESPKLIPVLNSTGAARKVNRRYSFTLTKE